jgi:putative lumazine-binding protein
VLPHPASARPTIERQQKDVRILDVFGNAAVAKVVMADWIDYLQLVRADGRWQIVNVLWERKPDRKA